MFKKIKIALRKKKNRKIVKLVIVLIVLGIGLTTAIIAQQTGDFSIFSSAKKKKKKRNPRLILKTTCSKRGSHYLCVNKQVGAIIVDEDGSRSRCYRTGKKFRLQPICGLERIDEEIEAMDQETKERTCSRNSHQLCVKKYLYTIFTSQNTRYQCIRTWKKDGVTSKKDGLQPICGVKVLNDNEETIDKGAKKDTCSEKSIDVCQYKQVEEKVMIDGNPFMCIKRIGEEWLGSPNCKVKPIYDDKVLQNYCSEDSLDICINKLVGARVTSNGIRYRCIRRPGEWPNQPECKVKMLDETVNDEEKVIDDRIETRWY